MHALRFAFFAFAFIGIAIARPVVIEEVATLWAPDTSWEYFGRFGVAIDGDFALVSGERYVTDPDSESGVRHDGAAFLYQRSGTAWNHVGQLGPTLDIPEWVRPGLAMKNGVAMTTIGYNARIFERTGTTWVEVPVTPSVLYNIQGPDIEIDNGRILVGRISCSHNSVVLRKISGAWAIEGELRGHTNDCGDTPPSPLQDLQGDRAIVFNEEGQNFEPPRARQYQRNANGIGWSEIGGINGNSFWFGPHIAQSGPYIAITGTRERGTNIYYQSGASSTLTRYGLQPANAYTQMDLTSATSLERVGSLFAQRNLAFDLLDPVINLFRINNDAARSSTHVATLQPNYPGWFGDLLDSSGNRVIVNSHFGYQVARIFELPASFTQPPVQTHDFESPASAAAWQPRPGSTFSIVRSGNTNVYRQPSTAGNPASWLPASSMTNQSIQAEVTIRAVSGADRWVGLVTRRTDDLNYYYATLRTSGAIEFKRMVNGVVTTLSTVPVNVVTGRKYRLRLQSMASLHRVFLDEHLENSVNDTAHAGGIAGIMMYRASADYDNVVVTPGPYATIYRNNFSTNLPNIWHQRGGQWQRTGGVLRQSSSADYARAFTGARTDDQIVQVRVRPLSFAGPDNWVGVLARWRDERNHLYVSLRNRGVISLWRRTNGTIQQLASRSFPVAVGTWYSVRVEVVGGQTRVFVDNQLQLSTNADPGPTDPSVEIAKGQVGLITYRATADFDDFLAYQP